VPVIVSVMNAALAPFGRPPPTVRSISRAESIVVSLPLDTPVDYRPSRLSYARTGVESTVNGDPGARAERSCHVTGLSLTQ
jgi:hypothetical protein